MHSIFQLTILSVELMEYAQYHINGKHTISSLIGNIVFNGNKIMIKFYYFGRE